MTITLTLTPPNVTRPVRWRARSPRPVNLERLVIRVEAALLDAAPGADLDAIVCAAIAAELEVAL